MGRGQRGCRGRDSAAGDRVLDGQQAAGRAARALGEPHWGCRVAQADIAAIRQAVERNYGRQMDDLARLVNIDSGTRDKAGVDRVGAAVRERLEELGAAITVFQQAEVGDHILGEIAGAGGPNVVIISHMDTVFPTGTAAERPFRIEGERAYGPGVADMKAGLLAGIYAARALRESGFDRFGTLRILCTSDEEIGSPTSRALIEDLARDSICALITEPARAGGQVVSARKGVGLFEIEVTGRSAHAGAEPEKGRSANLELAHKLIALHALNDYGVGTTVNVGVIKGGIARNVVSPSASGMIDVRVPNAEEMRRLEQAFREIEASPTLEGTATRITGALNRPPMPKTPAVEAMLDLARPLAEALGFQLLDIATGGGSDGNFTAGIGVPTLDGLGPQGGSAHSPDEYLVVGSVVPRTALMAALVWEAVLNADHLQRLRGTAGQ